VIALVGSLCLAVIVFGSDTLKPAVAVVPLLLLLGMKLLGLYDRDAPMIHKTTLEEVPTLFAAAACTVLVLFLGDNLFVGGDFGSMQGVGLLVTFFVSLVILRAGARRIWRASVPPERCLLVGNTSREPSLRGAIEMSEAAHVDLVAVVPIASWTGPNGSGRVPSRLLDELEIDRVIVAPGSSGGDELMFVIRALRDAGVKVSVIPDVSRLAGAAVQVDPIGGVSLLAMKRFAITGSSRAIKRTFDLVATTTILILASPLLLAIALAIRLEEPGSKVLYRQRRIGRHGAEFDILKFRSMVDGAHQLRAELAELDQGAEGFFKIHDDPRVTKVGRWIRRTNLDELPQLFNVLRGDMSLVGPRPLVPEEDANIAGLYRRRLDLRPGITGHWQVLGSSRIPMEEMVKLDYMYVSNWSLWSDLVLIARTVPLVMRRRGL